MAAADTLPRLEPTTSLLAPPQPAPRPSRADRSDYSERLTRRVTRESGRPKPSAAPTARRRAPSEATEGSTPTAPRTSAGDTDGSRLAADAVSGDEVTEAHDGAVGTEPAPARSAGTAPPAEGTQVVRPGETAALPVDGLAPGSPSDQARDEYGPDLPSLDLGATVDVPPPPWSMVEVAVTEGPGQTAPVRQAPIGVPPAISALLLGEEALPEPAGVPKIEVQAATPVPPRGFVASVLPASAATPSPLSAETSPVTSRAPNVLPAASSEPTSGAAAPAVGDALLPLASEEFPVVAPIGAAADKASAQPAEEPSLAVGTELDTATGRSTAVPVGPGSPATPPNPPAANEREQIPAAATSEAEAPASSRPVETCPEGQAQSVKVGRSDILAERHAAVDVTAEPISAVTEPSVDGVARDGESSRPLAVTGQLEAAAAPAAGGGRPSETGRSSQTGTVGVTRAEVSGDDLVRHAVSAFHAADGLDRPIRIRLTPPELGALRVEISRQDGHVAARFEVTTVAAQSTLIDHLSALRESLGRAGVAVERIEIRLAEPSREDGRSDGRGEEQSQRQGSGEDRRQRDDRRGPTWGGTGGEPNAVDDGSVPRAPAGMRPSLPKAAGADLIDIQV